MRCFLISILFVLGFSQIANGEQYKYGVGVALRSGNFAGVFSQGADAILRLGKLEFVGTVMSGSADMTSSIENDQLYSGSYYSSQVEIEKATFSQDAAVVTLRYHPMAGSFFLGLSAGVTESKAELVLNSVSDSSATIQIEKKTTRSLTGLSIGNHWMPGGVIIGVEWIGFFSASNAETTTTESSTGTANTDMTENRESFDDTYNTVAEGSTASLFVLSLGFMLGM